MRKNLRVRWMSAALLACGMPPAYAQSSPSPQQKPPAGQSPNVLKANTRLVVVDVVAFSPNGSVAKFQIYDMKATVNPGELSRLMESTFPCRVAIELKPRKYTLRLGVVDHASQHMGTPTAKVRVP
jgi:hypothetical protein